MNTKEFEEIIIQVIKKILNKSNGKFDVNKNMPLIGSGSLLDSMKLVELCIELEDIAEKKGFDFDWTSEKAMSKSSVCFRLFKVCSNLNNQKVKIDYYHWSKQRIRESNF